MQQTCCPPAAHVTRPPLCPSAPLPHCLHAQWFEGTSLIIISNTNWIGETVPCLTYGMRGMISLSIQVGREGGRVGCMAKGQQPCGHADMASAGGCSLGLSSLVHRQLLG